MSKELEAFKIVYNNFDYLISDVCIENDDVNICLKTIKEQLPTIKQSLQRLESIDNSNPSEALECLEYICKILNEKRIDVKWLFKHDYNTINKALLKAQTQEKEKLFFKNIHNTKVKTPLVSIFEGLSKDERFKFTEHIYYHWEEMKEALEDKNNELEKENVELKAKAQKEHKALEIIKKKCLTNCNLALVKDNLHYQNYCKEFEYFLNKYNESPNGFEITKDDLLTQEEFDLLKEMLE